LIGAFARRAAANDLDAAVLGQNQFAFDLYRNLAGKNDDNLIFSPLSVSTALSMVLAGANSSTADEMNAALHVTIPSQRYHTAVGGLLGTLNSPSQHFELAIANRLWAEKNFSIREEYLEVTGTHYQAPVESLDFINAPEPARQTINRWVEEQTHDKITDLIPKGLITPETALVLTNAMYFNGKWASSFGAQTHIAPFSLASGQQRSVEMMHQTSYLPYAATSEFEMLELPYRGGDQSLLVLLPREKHGLSALEETLTIDLLGQTADQLRPTYVSANLPKFKLESMFGLNETLQELGIRELFSARADLSGIADAPLHVSDALHKAIIEVDTEGTTAAAATAIIISVTGECYCPPPTPMPFNADHPFVFALRDKRTDSILFMGRLTEPEAASGIPGLATGPGSKLAPLVPEPGSGVLGVIAIGIAALALARRSSIRDLSR
jgi:serpin B